MQQSDQIDLRRNDMYKHVRDIQQAFASGDRESARLLTKGLQSEHSSTLHALQLESQSVEGCNLLEHVHAGSVKVAATCGNRAELPVRTASYRCLRDITWCRNADRGNYVRCLPACVKGMAALQMKQPK